jgi:hypothetical protein
MKTSFNFIKIVPTYQILQIYYTWLTPKPESFDVILCGNYL